MGTNHRSAREAVARGPTFPSDFQFAFFHEPLQNTPNGCFARIGGGLAPDILPASTGMGRYVIKDSLVRKCHKTIYQNCETNMSL